MNYGKSSYTKIAIAKQRAVSQKVMASIDYEKRRNSKRENQKVKSEINVYWLKRMIEAVDEAFASEPCVIEIFREKVFKKWEKYKYNREFYLAHTDIYRELEGRPEEYKKRVEQIVIMLRKEREMAESLKR